MVIARSSIRFRAGLTGREFIKSFLLVHGFDQKQADALTTTALERVSLLEAADRKVAAYSKGMRQRIRLAQAHWLINRRS